MSKAAFASVAVLAGALGCQTLLDLTPGTLRSEGGGGAPGTSVSSGGDGGDGGGGGRACDPDACPQPANPCEVASCSEQGGCSFKRLGIGESCGENKECDAEGVCRTARCANGMQDGDETGIDCGGATCPLCPTLILLATGQSRVVGARYGGTTWDDEVISSRSGFHDPALTITAEKHGIGVVAQGDETRNTLWYFRWSPPTDMGNGWSKAISEITGVEPISAPSIDSGRSGALMVYRRRDSSHAARAWTGDGWSEEAPIIFGDEPSLGSSAATLVMQGDLATIVFQSTKLGNSSLFSQQREDGAWKEAKHVASDVYDTIAPVMVALDPSPRRLLVYAVHGDRWLRSMYHDGSRWSEPKEIPSAASDREHLAKADSVTEWGFNFSLAALKGGKAILAFRQSNRLRVSHFDGENWSTDNDIDVSIRGVPAVARGIGGFDAELVYVDDGQGIIYHRRLMGNTWTEAKPVSKDWDDFTNVALISAP